MVRQVVILVGGKGTRLGPLTAATPKPLLHVAPGMRFLDVLIDNVARQGFADIILLAGYLGDQVEALYQGAASGLPQSVSFASLSRPGPAAHC